MKTFFRRCCHGLAALILGCGGPRFVTAAQLSVDPASPNCSHEAGPVLCSLSLAIESAAAGDRIRIAQGSYELWGETLIVDKALTLEGDGIGKTVLDGGGLHPGPVFDIRESAEVVVIRGLTIRNRQRDGRGRKRAAGIDHAGGDLTLEHVEIRETQGGWGGAIASGSPLSSLRIRHARFIDNSGFTGGAVDFRNAPGASLTMSDTQVTRNTAIFTGAGLFVRDAGEVLLERVEFSGNQSGNLGGAIFAASESERYSIALDQCTIRDNRSKSTAGIAVSGSGLVVTVQRVTFIDNVSAKTPIGSDCASDPAGAFRSRGENHFASEKGCAVTLIATDSVRPFRRDNDATD